MRSSYLSDGVLLLALGEDDKPADLRVEILRNGSAMRLESRFLSLQRPGSDPSGPAALAAVFLPDTELDPSESLVLCDSELGREVGSSELDVPTTDLKTFLREELAPLDADTRNWVVDFLARSVTTGRPSSRAAHALWHVREVLRERLPVHANTRDLPRGLFVEALMRVDDGSFFLKGWVHDEESDLVRLTAVSPEGARIELRDRLFRVPRPDVIEWSKAFGKGHQDVDIGLLCFFDIESPCVLPSPWILEMENADGNAVELYAPRVEDDTTVVRDSILFECSLSTRRILEEDMMADHIMPAMTRIQDREAIFGIESVTQYGVAPPSPDVSIVVPLYKNIDYVEGQLAEFADDPSIHEADLIYVLDSPEIIDSLDYLATELYPIYRVPFRVVVLKRNVGFAGANNAGASVARGRLLLLLNSDVLPDSPGWLDTMRDFYDSKPEMGALAPKLIYEDDSIQHAGMYFYQRTGSTVWLDHQSYRGLHRTFPPANIARSVPAVSGACMMIDRRLYEEFGGLSGQYVRGDYEDFDLCLRLIEARRENWYVPQAELYHLEGKSYTSDLRQPASAYNAWLQTHRWNERIEELIERYGSEDPAIQDGRVASREVR